MFAGTAKQQQEKEEQKQIRLIQDRHRAEIEAKKAAQETKKNK